MLGMSSFDVENLRKWFLVEQRDLPWRQNASPYAVWVSEVMLQQTQVAVVIPYFERWMKQFPTVAHLAEAPLDEIIKAWEGLGYYSRARNLHAGAKQVVAEFAGHLPSEEAKLKTIKGLGPYTVGAIRAFAFRQRAAAVDGNVLRVLSRYDLVQEDIAKPKTIQGLRLRAEQILPQHEPWVVAEALIELGATVCGRKPKCHACPLNRSCKAHAHGMSTSLPVKSGKVKTTPLFRAVAVLLSGGRCLVRRGEKGEIMSDLHEFPYFETDADGWSATRLQKMVGKEFGLQTELVSELDIVRHGFTRFDCRLSPVVFRCEEPLDVSGYRWVSFAEIDTLAFSSGHRRVCQSIRLLDTAPHADKLGDHDRDK